MNVARHYLAALSFLTGLFLLDFYITYLIIGSQGFEAEANPLMHWVLTYTGTVWSLLVVKITTLLFLNLVIGIVYNFGKERAQIGLAAGLWGLVLLTCGVDLWSVHVLRVVS